MRLEIIRELFALSLLATTAPTSITAFSHALETSLSDLGGGILSARDPLGLFTRDDDGCSSVGLSSDYTSCGGGLPNNFCCNTKVGDRCLPFNDNKSVICCPKGTDCSKFYQIGCAAQGLNVTAPGNANSSIHSTVINNGLITCSTGSCCPIGYTCATDNSGLCVPGNATASSSGSASAASLSSAPTSAASNPAGASSSSNTKSSDPTDDNQCNPFPPVALVAGILPGFVAGIAVAIVFIVCLGRKPSKNRDAKNDPNSRSPLPSPNPGYSDKSVFGPGNLNRQVSEPIMQDSGATRVDFLRRMSRARGSPTSTSQTAVSMRNSARVRSLFSGSRRGGEDVPDLPSTPMSKMKREPSTETINVFSPPNFEYAGTATQSEVGGPGNRATRWDDVMQGGGLGVSRGLAAPPAFLGSPGMVDPRKRPLDGGTRLR